jgi:hypothetical protein
MNGMMAQDDVSLIALLEQLDDREHLELPADFYYERANERFEAFFRALEVELGARLQSESGLMIQDASFHAMVRLPTGAERNDWLRFSNFGGIVSVYEDHNVPAELLERVVALAERHGYTYIPFRLLGGPTPAALVGRHIPDWWTRYFEWL